MMDFFSPTFKWMFLGPCSGLNGGLQLSCEIEVSHIGKGGRKTNGMCAKCLLAFFHMALGYIPEFPSIRRVNPY